MAKIGIYVPNDRMPDIERWRDEMNFSQLFMDAFDRAVAAQGDVGKIKNKEMKMVVERLKREAGGTYESGWKRGAKEGREWAMKHSHLSHLRQVGEGNLTFSGPDDDVMKFLYRYYEPSGYVRTEEAVREDAEFERIADAATWRHGFNAGFVEAAKSVWEAIGDAFQ